MLKILRSSVMPTQVTPPEYKNNFLNLYLDMAWWGVTNGSILAFLSIYATRLGATSFQLGLITAAPALVNLLFTLPGNILTRRLPTKKATTLSNLITRLFYFLLIPLPVLLPAEPQIWVIIGITLVMNIPGAIAAVMGNAFFAETVPIEWRAQVVGMRNAMFSATSMLVSFGAGMILDRMTFPLGYQVIFAIGFLGGMMSLVHLFLVKPLKQDFLAEAVSPSVKEELRAVEKYRFRTSLRNMVRPDVFKGPFGRVLVLVFSFYFAIFLVSPTYPLYQVNVLKMSDTTIGIGTAIYWVLFMLVSLQNRSICKRISLKWMTGIGGFLTCVTLTLFLVSYQSWVYYLSQVFSGAAWGLISGSLLNYVFERIPDHDRPAYLSWYNLSYNGALLVAGLTAPLFAAWIGLFGAIVLSIVLRVIASILLLKYG